MLVKHLLGKEVLDSHGDLLGRVADIEVELTTGAVKQILVRSGLLHIRYIQPEDVITAGDKIILGHRKANNQKLETFNFLGLKRRILCNW